MRGEGACLVAVYRFSRKLTVCSKAYFYFVVPISNHTSRLFTRVHLKIQDRIGVYCRSVLLGYKRWNVFPNQPGVPNVYL